jgi:tetratricopeptide (TPR) repeat protein
MFPRGDPLNASVFVVPRRWGVFAKIFATKASVYTAVGLAIACALATLIRVSAQADRGWIGNRVVQRGNDLKLRADNDVVIRTGAKLQIYRVERISGDGRRLWLSAESKGPSGWALGAEVIPIDQALEFFTTQIRDHRKEAFSHAMRSVLWQDTNELDRGLLDLDEAIRLEPRSAEFHVYRAVFWDRKRKKYDKAIADYTEAIRLDSKDALAYNGRGYAFSEKKEYDKAIADYTASIRLDPKDAANYVRRGYAFSEKKEYDKAIAEYTEAIRLDPTDSTYYYFRGGSWTKNKECDKAIADFTEAIRLEPAFGFAYSARGFAWFEKREYGKAIADFSDAIRLDPKDADNYVLRGNAWSEKREYGKAIADFSDAIRLDPKHAFAYSDRDRALRQFDEALDDFEQRFRLLLPQR